MSSTGNTFHFLKLKNTSIFQQLQIEEALLRVDNRNWCIINEGTPEAIVMGISGKAERFVDSKILQKYPMPIIRRFSGGGTVLVDEHTYFVTFICNANEIDVPSYPEKAHKWAETVYTPVFQGHPFSLRENDYVFGEKKFGGNAQYFRKDRWLHHTSFLWDFDPKKMQCLLIPEKMPSYRERRSHDDFLSSLKEIFPLKSSFAVGLIRSLQEKYQLVEMKIEDIEETLATPHRKSTVII